MNKLEKLFENENNWTKKSLARNKKGVRVGARSNNAFCWCLRGGVIKIYRSKKINEILEVMGKRIKKKYLIDLIFTDKFFNSNNIVTYFNDHPNTKIEDIREIIKDIPGA